MAPPKITKGSPRPLRKDYPSDTAFFAAVKQWNDLNDPAKSSTTVEQPDVKTTNTSDIQSGVISQSRKSTDWNAFIDGSFVVQDNNLAVGETPFVTYKDPKASSVVAPSVVVILPVPGQPGSYEIVNREEYLDELVKIIGRSPGNIAYWKTQLKDYYSSDAAFARSLSGGPVVDKDTEFGKALKRAVNEIAFDNLSKATENVNSNILNTSGFYDINSWIQARTPLPGKESTSSSTKNFTLKADAIADFMREAQSQVGDLELINNIDALANAYWEKVHNEELKRMGKSTSVYDPITRRTIHTSTGFQMPSQTLLKEWRIGFLTKGAVGKGNTVISTGIRNVNAIDLQDAGGDLGDNYTKLKGYAFEYGIRLSDAELKNKAAEISISGGSIEEQSKTILLAARLKYPSLAPYIEAGLKTRDIASQFIKKKQDTLELADGSVDIFDTDVQAAMSGDKLMSDYDYELKLRSNPAWRKTKSANESAAAMVQTFLSAWGKVG